MRRHESYTLKESASIDLSELVCVCEPNERESEKGRRRGEESEAGSREGGCAKLELNSCQKSTCLLVWLEPEADLISWEGSRLIKTHLALREPK